MTKNHLFWVKACASDRGVKKNRQSSKQFTKTVSEMSHLRPSKNGLKRGNKLILKEVQENLLQQTYPDPEPIAR